MVLSAEHFPFPRSLSERVFERFKPEGDEPNAPLDHGEVIKHLAKHKDDDLAPVAMLDRRAGKRRQAAALSHMDRALISWVGVAFEEWQAQFPMEDPVSGQLLRLQYLAAAMTLSDESFLTPGEHPLHQLLDALQHGAVGWQARLDRAGQMLEQRIQRSIDKALEWFSDNSISLPAITKELIAANERDTARAERMVQRLAETEAARLQTLGAANDAALFINEGLEDYELPSAIGDFLKGPWYDSAQLVLVKHGRDSEEWSEMQEVTEDLLKSVANSEQGDSAKREKQQRQVVDDLRRWLLSLEHDSDEMDGAIGLVEYAHLRLQHGQQVDHVTIEPLPVEAAGHTSAAAEADELHIGDWYCFKDDEGELRAQLALQLEDGQHLIFTNVVGLKAIDLTRAALRQQLSDGSARHLPNTASFSMSLARAAGIHTDRDFQLFLDPAAVLPEESAEQIEPEEATEAVAEADDQDAPDLAQAGEGMANESDGDTEPQPAKSDPDKSAEDALEIDEPQEVKSTHRAPPPSPPRPAPRAPAPGVPPGYDQFNPDSPANKPVTDVDVRMGAWLGFHDGDTPVMAKLAVYDPRGDNYIFVNRKGIALRELNRAQLLDLMDRGLVDILEMRSYFRDEVERAREEKS